MTALNQDLSGPDAADLSAASLAIARRLVNGGTLWCAAPASPSRALRAVSAFSPDADAGTTRVHARTVEGPLLGSLRAGALAGDVLVLLAGSAETEVDGLRQRAAAWGVLTVWIGDGPRPAPGTADYVLWADAPSERGPLEAVCSRLAELTLDRLEHPEAIEPERAACGEEVCITCSDEGRLGEVVAILADGRAQVRTPAGLEAVDTTLIDQAHPGDLVLIHAGTAVTLVEGSPR